MVLGPWQGLRAAAPSLWRWDRRALQRLVSCARERGQRAQRRPQTQEEGILVMLVHLPLHLTDVSLTLSVPPGWCKVRRQPVLETPLAEEACSLCCFCTSTYWFSTNLAAIIIITTHIIIIIVKELLMRGIFRCFANIIFAKLYNLQRKELLNPFHRHGHKLSTVNQVAQGHISYICY